MACPTAPPTYWLRTAKLCKGENSYRSGVYVRGLRPDTEYLDECIIGNLN
jgi:hypothetical protein